MTVAVIMTALNFLPNNDISPDNTTILDPMINIIFQFMLLH